MNDFDYVFTPEQYEELNNAYSKKFASNTFSITTDLNTIIKAIEQNGFHLSTKLQTQIQNNLLQAKEILYLVHQDNLSNNLKVNNNPFQLISLLSALSNKLNSYTLKSPYQILFLKTNNLIISSIQIIADNFSNKSIKTFKYI